MTPDDYGDASTAARKSLEAVREAVKGYIGVRPYQQRLLDAVAAGELPMLYQRNSGKSCSTDWIIHKAPFREVSAALERGTGELIRGGLAFQSLDPLLCPPPDGDGCDCGQCALCQGCPSGAADVENDAQKV